MFVCAGSAGPDGGYDRAGQWNTRNHGQELRWVQRLAVSIVEQVPCYFWPLSRNCDFVGNCKHHHHTPCCSRLHFKLVGGLLALLEYYNYTNCYEPDSFWRWRKIAVSHHVWLQIKWTVFCSTRYARDRWWWAGGWVGCSGRWDSTGWWHVVSGWGIKGTKCTDFGAWGRQCCQQGMWYWGHRSWRVGVIVPGRLRPSFPQGSSFLEGWHRANDFPFQKKGFSISPCSEFHFVSASSVFVHQRLCYFRNFIINVRTFNRKHQE